MAKKTYDENVLIELRRKYSKDEYVATLLKQIQEIELEKGMVISERDEALYKLKKLSVMDPKAKARYCQKLFYKKLITEIKSLRESLRREKITSSRYLCELLQLKQK